MVLQVTVRYYIVLSQSREINLFASYSLNSNRMELYTHIRESKVFLTGLYTMKAIAYLRLISWRALIWSGKVVLSHIEIAYDIVID